MLLESSIKIFADEAGNEKLWSFPDTDNSLEKFEFPSQSVIVQEAHFTLQISWQTTFPWKVWTLTLLFKFMRRLKLIMSRIRLWKLRSESSRRNNLRSSWKIMLRLIKTLCFEQAFVAELQPSLYRERVCSSWNVWPCIFDNHCWLRSPVHVITFSSKSDGWCLPLLHSRHGTCPVSICTLRRNFPLQFLSFKFFLSYCPLRSWRWVFSLLW